MGKPKSKRQRRAKEAREQAAQEEAARRAVELVATLLLCAALAVAQDEALRQRMVMGLHRARMRALMRAAQFLARRSAAEEARGSDRGAVLWEAAAMLASRAAKAEQAYERVRLAG